MNEQKTDEKMNEQKTGEKMNELHPDYLKMKATGMFDVVYKRLSKPDLAIVEKRTSDLIRALAQTREGLELALGDKKQRSKIYERAGMTDPNKE